MRERYGTGGAVLNWIKSYLTGRSQHVVIDGLLSNVKKLKSGVPQGSVLGPKFFTMYTSPLQDIFGQHGIDNHMFADDTQMYMSLNSGSDLESNISRMESCIEDVREWMANNLLKLNEEKTKVILFGSKHNLKRTDRISLKIGEHTVISSTTVPNLGVIYDSSLAMENQVSTLRRSCYYQLRNKGRIRKYLDDDATKSLIYAFVLLRLDYGNALLYGISDTLSSRLQRVQNLAARIITRTSRYEHITPSLINLHWLPIKSRMIYKILLYTFKAISNQAPSYIGDMLSLYKPERALQSAQTIQLVVPQVKSATYGDRNFVHAAPVLWNQLPPDLQRTETIGAFKTNLKTHLFKAAYTHSA